MHKSRSGEFAGIVQAISVTNASAVALPLARPSITGRIFDLQTFSTHDGPGIRTTVFLKGCPLRCLWCHNPESMSTKRLIGFVDHKCINCGWCEKICEHDGHTEDEQNHEYHRENCVMCGDCVDVCPTGTLEMMGKDVTCEWVIEQVVADSMFYSRSGGGITLSGGEPLLQPEFAASILRRAKEAGLHCTVDTSGYATWQSAQPIFELADLVLFDLKAADDDTHRQLTGVGDALIRENLVRLLSLESGPQVWLRIPLIPGCNDFDDMLRKMAQICAAYSESPRVERVYLMPYHRMAEGKYAQYGMDYELAGTEAPIDQMLERAKTIFSKAGIEALTDH